MHMKMSTLSWPDFLAEAEQFIKWSESLHDDWQLITKNEHEGNAYLVYKQKLLIDKDIKSESEVSPCLGDVTVPDLDTLTADVEALQTAQELLQIEYHIVYSVSYQVPMLYFQAKRRDGRALSLEESWRFFRNYHTEQLQLELKRADMLNVLTQLEHPVLFRPFLALHPCRTAELLGQAGRSQNRILTFISLMGPFVRLKLSNEYGVKAKAIKENSTSSI